MADGEKRNIPLDRVGYCIFVHQLCGLAFIPQITSNVRNGHVMTAVVPCQDPLNIHHKIQWLVFH